MEIKIENHRILDIPAYFLMQLLQLRYKEYCQTEKAFTFDEFIEQEGLKNSADRLWRDIDYDEIRPSPL